MITLPAVAPGTYEVTELFAPEGWIGSTASVVLEPERFGTSPDPTGDSEGDGKNVATFVNTLGSVTFFKAYAGGGNAAGATFLLERDGSDEDALFDDGSLSVTDNGENDADNAMGTIKVSGLKTGSWRITEVSAPTGWVKDGSTVTFQINSTTPNPQLGNPTFDNPRQTYPLSALKVGVAPGEAIDGAKIAGAVFKLWRDDNGVAGLQTSDPDGGGPQVADSSTGTCKIVTKATNSGLPNAVITDTATLSGLNSRAAGTVTFDLYGPFTTDPTPASCVATAKVNTTPIGATRTVNGTATAP